MLSYCLGTVNDFHWGLKPVLSYSYSKPHTFSTFIGEDRENARELEVRMSSVCENHHGSVAEGLNKW